MGQSITEFALTRVTPIPSSGPVRIEFTLPEDARVQLRVLDVRGRLVTTLSSGMHRRGRYQATWAGRTERGKASAGVYFVQYEAPGKHLVKRIVFVR
jgi:hypothetical protein